MKMKMLELNDGGQIDALGLGTYEMQQEAVGGAVAAAMDVGYRLYDTAQVYKNEAQVSQGIKDTGRKREEVFITTKVSTERQGYENAKTSVIESLERMDLEYLDLVLIHWPGVKGLDKKSPENKKLRHESYRALLDLRKEGKIRHVGVSNFAVKHLRELFEEFEEKPQVNQIEFSPICYPSKIMQFCQNNKVVVQSYSTLGRGKLVSEEWIQKYPVLRRLQQKGNVSNFILKWALDKGCGVIPKSTRPERIRENFGALSVTLDLQDAQDLDSFPVMHRTCWDPNEIE